MGCFNPRLLLCRAGFLLTAILFILVTAGAQPAPCGPDPDMTSTCIEACVICDIDGFTGINDDTEQGQAPPGFCTNVVHHMQWIAFIAGSTNLTITVTPTDCDLGEGLEVGIYESLNCSTFNLVSNCDTDIGEGEVGVFNNTEPLVIGQYYYFVMDGNMGDICKYTIHVTSGSTLVPPLPPAAPVAGPALLCQSESATYSIPAITGANFYKWYLNGVAVADGTEVELDFPVAGTYELCVSAFNVCDTVEPSCMTIQVLPPVTTNLTQVICQGDCFDVADTTVCSAGNYTFHLQTINGCDSTVNLAVSILPEVMYNLEATICSTDSLLVGDTWYHPPGQFVEMQTSYNGCDSTIQLTLNAIICEINGSAIPIPVLCNGGQTGSLAFTVKDGTPPFTYTWQRLGGNPSGNGTVSALNTPESLLNLPAGTYLVNVNDNFGNDAVFTAVVTEPPVLTAGFTESDFSGFNIDCRGALTGVLTAVPAGGKAPFTYQWSNGAAQAVINNIAAGIYTVTVTDVNGCTFVTQDTLTEPPALVFSATFADPGCDGNDTGVIGVDQTSGGVPPYQYALSGEPFGDATQYTGLVQGDYTLTVKDINGCTTDTTATLTAAQIPTVDAGNDIEIALGESQQLQVVVYPVPETIQWTPATGLSCTDCLKPVATPYETTVYTIRVSSKDGCPGIDSLTVKSLKIRHVYVPNAFSPDDDGDNDVFTVFTNVAVKTVKKLRVYSRWGELVYEGTNIPPNDLSYGWDGTFRGKDVPVGVYVWTAEIEFLDGVVEMEKGDVSILK